MLLYKYQKAKWGKAVLRKLQLKMTPPNEFNDPFEFTPATRNPIESLDSHNLAKLNTWLHKKGLGISSIESLRKVLPVLVKNNPRARDFALGLVRADMASLNRASKHFGVLCLAESAADIRMWAHYGDNHRGIVVGLDFDYEVSGIDGVLSFGKVRYRKKRCLLEPTLPGGKAFHNQMVKITMTKSRTWRDEREHRMVVRLQDIQGKQSNSKAFSHFLRVRPQTIREVVMGCCISEADNRAIQNLIKAKLPHVRLSKLSRHVTEFEMVHVSVR